MPIKALFISICLFFFLLLGIQLEAYGQVAVTLQLPQSGLIQKNQLWNMTLINPGNTIDIQIEISLFENSSNQKILSATSRRLTLGKGGKLINWNDVQPVSYIYTGYSNLTTTVNDILPAGYYKVCYTVVQFITDRIEPLSEECTEFEVIPLSPPILTLPQDNAAVDGLYPQFNWVPPMPVSMLKGLRYQFLLVEQLPGQAIDAAIQYNIPVYIRDQLIQPFFNYPSSAKPLEKDKNYLWQVTAKTNSYTSKTEVWAFHYKENTQVKKQSAQYVKLSLGLTNTAFISNGVLKGLYTNEINDAAIVYRIYRLLPEKQENILSGEIKIKRGENFLDVNIGEKKALQDGGTYIWELRNSRGEKYQMQFTFFADEDSVEAKTQN